MTQKKKVKVFTVSSTSPASPPRPYESFEIEAPTLDGLLVATKQHLKKSGFSKERAISFTPEGLVAYIEEKS